MRFNLLSLLVVICAASVAVGLYVPHYVRAAAVSRAREAGAMIYAVHHAQKDWFANDRDGNGARDFWHADIYGLYGLDVGGRTAAAIEESIALSDAGSRTAEYAHVRPRKSGGARGGHYVRAFDTREGAAMQPTQFAVMAFPATPSDATLYLTWEDTSPNRKYDLPARFEAVVAPMEPGRDSRCFLRGTGAPCLERFDLPASPGAIGVGRYG
jgi:hypothetical protein